jgi:predicted nuclease of predicted toxin-antitoxin system
MKLLFDHNLSPRLVNCSTGDIETILRTSFVDIENFHQDQNLGIFTLY